MEMVSFLSSVINANLNHDIVLCSRSALHLLLYACVEHQSAGKTVLYIIPISYFKELEQLLLFVKC